MSEKNTNQTIEKALSDEDKALVGNVMSLLAELGASSKSDGEEDEEKEKKSKKAEDEDEDKDKDKDKEEDKEKEAKKQADIISTIAEKTAEILAKKSEKENATAEKNAEDEGVKKQLSDIAGVLKTLTDNQIDQANALDGLFGGLGIADDIKKSHEEKANKSEDTLTDDQKLASVIASSIAEVMKSTNGDDKTGHAPVIRSADGKERTVTKSLSDVDVMSALVLKK
jgi:hypothetical protein